MSGLMEVEEVEEVAFEDEPSEVEIEDGVTVTTEVEYIPEEPPVGGEGGDPPPSFTDRGGGEEEGVSGRSFMQIPHEESARSMISQSPVRPFAGRRLGTVVPTSPMEYDEEEIIVEEEEEEEKTPLSFSNVLESAPSQDNSADDNEIVEVPFQDEPEQQVPPESSKWFGKRESKDVDESRKIEPKKQVPNELQERAPPLTTTVVAGGNQDEENQVHQGHTKNRAGATDDESQDKSNQSTIGASRERKIVTCLTLALCCLGMFVTLAIGIWMGVAIGRKRERQRYIVPAVTPPPIVTVPTPTGAPSVMPVPAAPSSTPTSVASALLEFLVESSFDEGGALRIEGSPQEQAFVWLAENANITNYSDSRKLARYALATFYFATNGTSSWDKTIVEDGWFTDASECEWGSTTTSSACDERGTYTSLTLDFAGVSGELPDEIAYLTGLERLSLRSREKPSLGGTLPTILGVLTNLVTIRLNGNLLVGTVPTEIGLMTNMRVLMLSDNLLEGTIPTEIGNIAGTTINMDGNALTGPIPTQLFQLSSLTALELGSNELSGEIPTEIALSSSINSLMLNSNKLTGSIPSEIGMLTQIRSFLTLADNELSGPIPDEMGLLSNIRNLELQNNNLSGSLPSQIARLTDLRLVRIDGNSNIAGSVSEAICSIWEANPFTVSYSDCVSSFFTCDCCTFCCTSSLCTCNSDDESICS